MPSTQLQASQILHRPPDLRSEAHSSASRRRREVRLEGCRLVIVPAIAVVMEERIQTLQINARRLAEPVVDRPCYTKTVAIVAIVALVITTKKDRARLHVIDAAPIPVIGCTGEDT